MNVNYSATDKAISDCMAAFPIAGFSDTFFRVDGEGPINFSR
jgi:hypothetical protein